MVVFGGRGGVYFSDNYLNNDAWELALGTLYWKRLTPMGPVPAARSEHTAIYDPVRDRMVVFGGNVDLYGNKLNDTWTLTGGTPLAVDGDVPGQLQFGVPRPNPARGATLVDFELREPARVILDVFDTHGRRIKRIADGWFAAGQHVSRWQGDDDQGHAIESGVYFVRVQRGSFIATRRIVRVR
jgi:hypothetical protein